MSFNNLTEVLNTYDKNSNFNEIIKFIISEEQYPFEKEYLEKINRFDVIYNQYYRDKRRKFYMENNIYDTCKYKSEIPTWMVDRLLYLDLEDSREKFLFSNVLDYMLKRNLIS